MSEEDKNKAAKAQMARIRRKIQKTKPKNSDGTTFYENMKGDDKGPNYRGRHENTEE